jgi:tetratricopeptide (TPR) repeat protein
VPRENEPHGIPPARNRRLIPAAVCLIVLVAIVYAPVRHHEFVNYDDDRYVTENPFVRQGLSAASVRWAFTATHASNWHPLTWLSHMLDVELYSLEPAGHHLTSLALHAVNAVLLMWVLYMMTGRFRPSLLVALLFALHPLRVESVAWVAERKDVLAGLFWMSTLLAYVFYARRPGAARYGFVLACFALGLMAKPMLVTLPFVLLLLDRWPLRWMAGGASVIRRRVVEKLPLFALSAASVAITLVAQKGGGAMRATEIWPLGHRLANALIAYIAYLWKTVWPAGLACFYPHPAALGGDGPWIGWSVVAAVVLAIATVVAVFAMRRRPHVAVGWLWYLGTLVPVIGVVQVGSQAMADRYTYLPLIGIYIVVAWTLMEWIERHERFRAFLVPAVAIALAACATVTRLQVAHWENGQALFEHALRVTRDNYVAHNNLGSLFESRGDLERAATQFEQSLRIRPDFPPAHNNLGLVLTQRGDLPRAIEHLERAVALEPGYAEAHNNLGAALQRQGKIARAAEQFERAVSLDPNHAEAHNNLGVILEHRRDPVRAAEHYDRALRIDPDFAEAHSNLGNVLLGRGDLAGARARYESALAVRPDFAEAHNNLGFVLARQGDLRGAVSHYRSALEIRPALFQAASGLAWILATSADATLRDGNEALAWAEHCAEATSYRDAACLETLAAAHAELGDFEPAIRWQGRAVDLVPADRNADLRARLDLYRTRRPYREPTPR